MHPECLTILRNGQEPSTVAFYYKVLVFTSAKICHAKTHVKLKQSVYLPGQAIVIPAGQWLLPIPVVLIVL